MPFPFEIYLASNGVADAFNAYVRKLRTSGKVRMAYNQTLDEAAYLVLTFRVRDHHEAFKVRLTENST